MGYLALLEHPFYNGDLQHLNERRVGMLFSRRHRYEVLQQLSLPLTLRNTVFYVLEEHSESGYSDWGSRHEHVTFLQAEYQYKRHLGLEQVTCFGEGNTRVASDLEGVIKRGRPSEVLDMIEAFLKILDDAERVKCEREINQVFQEHRQPWRLLDEQFMKIDSQYLSEEVLSKAHSLLADQGFEGPLDEFERALRSYSSGDLRTAITDANNALESTIKAVLDIQREKPGRLIRALIDSGLIPEYYDGFLTSVEQIVRAVSAERNEPGRAHGQGASLGKIDPSLAEFCLHLAGTLIVFLVKKYREKTSFEPDDLPF